MLGDSRRSSPGATAAEAAATECAGQPNGTAAPSATARLLYGATEKYLPLPPCWPWLSRTANGSDVTSMEEGLSLEPKLRGLALCAWRPETKRLRSRLWWS